MKRKNERTAQMKVVTVVGARPQFIKAVPVSLALRKAGIEECLVHTGQHYDYEMSEVFFKTLGLKRPDHDLGIGSMSHGAQTGRMIEAIEKVLFAESPRAIMIYGDTNSTLAGALAASKMNIPVIHVEAGLRSFNRKMPEEINRVAADHLSSLLFAPTDESVRNLKREGIGGTIIRTGDIMYDTCLLFRKEFRKRVKPLMKELGLESGGYGVVTIHRQENTDDKRNWDLINKALKEIADGGLKLVWPVHPRVREKLRGKKQRNLILSPPLSYLDMQALLSNAGIVLTDSGGLQKEAYFHEVPCVTLRDETEWSELVDAGVNMIAGAESSKIVELARELAGSKLVFRKNIYGKGDTSGKIAKAIADFLDKE